MSFLPAWLTLLGADVRDGAPLTDGEGLLNLIRIGFGLILLAVPVAMTVCYRRFSQRGVRILLIAHWTMTALILMAYVFGYLSSANWRLSPILASSILLLVVFSHWIATEAGFPRFCLLTLGPAALAALIALSAVLGMPHDYGRQDGLPALAQYLEDSGLSYGMLPSGTPRRSRCCPIRRSRCATSTWTRTAAFRFTGIKATASGSSHRRGRNSISCC